MASDRKRALKRLQALAERVELHLEIIAADPVDEALRHHRHEVRNWLRQMEEVVHHVGRKTGAEWQARIRAYQATLEEAGGEPGA